MYDKCKHRQNKKNNTHIWKWGGPLIDRHNEMKQII